MPYVERRDKKIIAIYNRPQPKRAEKFLPDDDPEIVEFLREPEPEPSEVEILKSRLDSLENELVRKEIITEAELTASR